MAHSPIEAKEAFRRIIRLIVGERDDAGSCGIHIHGQFRPHEDDDLCIPRNINSAFLISLCGEETPGYEKALDNILKYYNNERTHQDCNMNDRALSNCPPVHPIASSA